MLETQPLQPVVFPPDGGIRYRVRTGDSWESIARANGIDTWALIEFNFPVVKGTPDFQTKCRQVNWLLHRYVGCEKSADGKNYRFDSTDSPGLVYIPSGGVPMTHRVKLHFRSLSLTQIPFETAFRNAQRVYGQYGIRIDFGSGMSLGLPEEQAERLERVDGVCEWTITSGEFNEVQSLAGFIPNNEIAVFYVNEFSSGKLGCGGHFPGKHACIVAAAGSQWTTAHEVGHVLLGSGFPRVHESSTLNLMYRSTPGITGNPPVLLPDQLTQIKKSPCCVRI
jgi:hypothetical protein